MWISINYITVSFLTPDFDGTMDIMELNVYSTNNEWKPAELKKTVAQDLKNGTITLFKLLSFDSLKIAVYPKSKLLVPGAMDDPLVKVLLKKMMIMIMKATV